MTEFKCFVCEKVYRPEDCSAIQNLCVNCAHVREAEPLDTRCEQFDPSQEDYETTERPEAAL